MDIVYCVVADPPQAHLCCAVQATSYTVVSFSVLAGMVDDGVVCLQGESAQVQLIALVHV